MLVEKDKPNFHLSWLARTCQITTKDAECSVMVPPQTFFLINIINKYHQKVRSDIIIFLQLMKFRRNLTVAQSDPMTLYQLKYDG